MTHSHVVFSYIAAGTKESFVKRELGCLILPDVTDTAAMYRADHDRSTSTTVT